MKNLKGDGRVDSLGQVQREQAAAEGEEETQTPLLDRNLSRSKGDITTQLTALITHSLTLQTNKHLLVVLSVWNGSRSVFKDGDKEPSEVHQRDEVQTSRLEKLSPLRSCRSSGGHHGSPKAEGQLHCQQNRLLLRMGPRLQPQAFDEGSHPRCWRLLPQGSHRSTGSLPSPRERCVLVFSLCHVASIEWLIPSLPNS